MKVTSAERQHIELSSELSEIRYILDSLEKGLYYEKSDVREHGTIPKNVEKLREYIAGALIKMQSGQCGQNIDVEKALMGKSDHD